MHRSIGLKAILLACFVAGIPSGVFAQQPSVQVLDCLERLADLCRDTSDDPSVCHLFDPPAIETLQTISGFFNAIDSLPQEQREDLICARFGSNKAIRGVSLGQFRDGYVSSSWHGNVIVSCSPIDMTAPDRFAAAALKATVYGGTSPEGPDTVDINGTLKQVRIIESKPVHPLHQQIILDPCRVTKMYRKNEVVTFDQLTREAREATRQQYIRYMDAGLVPPDVENLRATPAQQTITLSWSRPAISNFRGVRVISRTDRLPERHDDGTVLYEGVENFCVDANLIPSTTYYYGVYVRNELGKYSKGAHLMASTECQPVIDRVTPVLHGDVATISWTDPTCTFSSDVLLVRRTDRMPSDQNDGEIVCSTKTSPCVIRNLVFLTTYYMKMFFPTNNGEYAVQWFDPIFQSSVLPQAAVVPQETPSLPASVTPTDSQRNNQPTNGLKRLVGNTERWWDSIPVIWRNSVRAFFGLCVLVILAVRLRRRAKRKAEPN